ncbi:HNH endonuclease signature motif containing protein, partial [Oryzobacter sp. R7]|uniref:HNH endonuclease signature motif containing protein n=1 Tax=Oryzobacter faecalis TaxID=3388656 RepID=UPI00398CC5EB
TGDLDRYRAGVVAHELEEAPAPVAEAVIATLGQLLASETGVQLRRRTRRLLARVSPDLLRQRAQRARQECGLRRRVGEPGVDVWEGTFPSEQAAKAWAAIDTRAHQLLTDGTVDRIDRARAQALIDLVMQSATVTTVITLTVPAAAPATATGDEAAGATDEPAPIPENDPTAVATAPVPTPTTGHARANDAEPAIPAEHSTAGAISTAAATAETTPTVSEDRTASGRPAATDESATATAVAAAADRRMAADGGFVEVATGRGTEQVLVPTAWLTDQLTATTTSDQTPDNGQARTRASANGDHDEVRVQTRSCDPVTGALLSDEESGAYRPPERLAALVRHRDGRCRFPGCSVAARFCDLDHVRPWPGGPTTAANLLLLCRRHHRVKQRPGWHVNLHPDGTATWTDPAGRSRTTAPVDALHTATLPAPAIDEAEHAQATFAASDPTATAMVTTSTSTVTTSTVTTLVADRHSGLEFRLEHLLGSALANVPVRRARQTSGRQPATVSRPVDTVTVLDPHRPHHRFRQRSWTRTDADLPPF